MDAGSIPAASTNNTFQEVPESLIKPCFHCENTALLFLVDPTKFLTSHIFGGTFEGISQHQKDRCPQMAKIVKPLTAAQIKNSKPKDKPYKLADGNGLYLEVMPTGSKLWRMKYKQTNGKESRLSFGKYPVVSLEQARKKRADAQRLQANGVDPGAHNKAMKAASEAERQNTFEVIAREWFEKFSTEWVESHASKIIRRLERDVFPLIGRRPISEIRAPELLGVLQQIEERGAVETAHRCKSNCGQIFRYAIATGRLQRDISQDLKGALKPVSGKHFAAITEPTRVGELLRQIDGYSGTFIVKCALRLAPYVFVRPGELRHALWQDIDFEKKEWRFFVSKTKSQHIVPLAQQAIHILKEIQPHTDQSEYVFHSPRSRSRPLSDNAILAALRQMGISREEMTGHGFRAMARTLLDEVLGFRPDHIEHQLAHEVKDPLGRAYNRTSHLDARRKMMQDWADYLDTLKAAKE